MGLKRRNYKPLLLALMTVLTVGVAEALEALETSILPSNTHFSIKFPLTAMVDLAGTWTHDQVIEQIRMAEQIYAQCEVSIDPIALVDFRHPTNGEIHQERDYEFTKDLPQETQRPVVVFTEKVFLAPLKPGKPSRAVDGYANTDYTQQHEFEDISRDTAFINHRIFKFSPRDLRHATAHELAHILLNGRHNDLPDNVLGRWGGSKFTEEQCQNLRNNILSHAF